MTFRQFLRIVELRTKLVSASSLLLGTLYAAFASGRFSPARFALMAAAGLAVDMGTTAFNSFYDYLRGVDNPALNREPDKVLVHEGVPPAEALLAGLGLYLLAGLLGGALALLTDPWLAPVGAACMAVGFLYNGGPHPISRTPFGELFAGGFLGSVLFLIACFVQAGSLPAGAAAASLPSLLLVASILSVNNACDLEADRAAGRRTLAVLLGPRPAEALVYGLGAAAWLSAAGLAFTGILPRLSLAALGPALVYALAVYRGMHRRGYSLASKGASMLGVLKVFAAYSLAAAAGLAAGLLGRT